MNWACRRRKFLKLKDVPAEKLVEVQGASAKKSAGGG